MSFKQTVVGLIPEEWEVESINNLKSSIKNSIAMGPFGSRIKKENFIDQGIPVIRGVNLKHFEFYEDAFVFVSEEKAEELKASWVKRGDIVITHRGTLGQVGYIPEDSKYKKYIVSQSGMKLSCDEDKVISKYIYYYLNSNIGQYFLLMNKSQVGVPAIAQASTSLKKIPVPLPKIKEQKSIVSILSNLDAKIGNNNLINKKLEEMAQAIFKQWFVDFEFPNEDGELYKSNGGEMVESQLGAFPSKWTTAKLTEIADLIMGQSPKGDTYNNGGKGLGLVNGASDFKVGIIAPLKYTTDPKKVSREGDWIFGVRATVGNVTYVDKEYCLGRGVGVARVHLPELNEFLYFQLVNGIDYLEKTAMGSVYINLSKVDLENISFVLPQKDILDKFHNIVKPMFEKINMLRLENERLVLLRDTLLPKLMSGEIRVPIES